MVPGIVGHCLQWTLRRIGVSNRNWYRTKHRNRDVCAVPRQIPGSRTRYSRSEDGGKILWTSVHKRATESTHARGKLCIRGTGTRGLILRCNICSLARKQTCLCFFAVDCRATCAASASIYFSWCSMYSVLFESWIEVFN